jgi:ATP-dependent RNA helicase RhlE
LTSFKDFALHERIQQAITDLGYETPTPIQQEAIPELLKGRDLLGVAQTGTGKTAAFALPSLNLHLSNPQPRVPKSVRVLVIAPTRELVLQIAENYKTYSKRMNCVIQTVFGGSPIQRQIGALRKGVDVLVSTPGRLIDLMERRAVTLDFTDIVVLDEADQMFDMGFIHDLRKIMNAAPEDRQNLLFSATMPKQISQMADEYLKDPVRVSVAVESTTAERVAQRLVHIARDNKNEMLEAVLEDPSAEKVVVFTRTKHCADRVCKILEKQGHKAIAIHGGRSQSQRIKAMDQYRKGKADILVATDVVARGIDIKGITHVINYEMPNIAEQYVHRIGRTGRAGEEGVAISFVDRDELYYLQSIERASKIKIELLDVDEDLAEILLPEPDEKTKIIKPDIRGGGGGGRGRGGPPRGGRPGGGRPQGRGGDRRGRPDGRRDERGGDRRGGENRPRRADADGEQRFEGQRSDGDRRPRRANGEDNRSRGDASNRSERPDRRPRRDNAEAGGRKPWGERSERGDRQERRPRSENAERGDRRPRGDKQERPMSRDENVRRASSDIPKRPRRQDTAERGESSARKPFSKRPSNDGSGDAPVRRKSAGGKAFAKKDGFKGNRQNESRGNSGRPDQRGGKRPAFNKGGKPKGTSGSRRSPVDA